MINKIIIFNYLSTPYALFLFVFIVKWLKAYSLLGNWLNLFCRWHHRRLIFTKEWFPGKSSTLNAIGRVVYPLVLTINSLVLSSQYMVGLQVNFLWSRHDHWQLWPMNDGQKWWVLPPAEVLRTCIWFSTSCFLASVELKAYMEVEPPDPGSLSNYVEQSSLLIHTGHVGHAIPFCF